ncbi:MAG: hypothetical protein SFU86_18565 [Pirellulaceae bacterium]|nr:hypothetical protein [Pirellulaceae bacterium]
MRSTPRPARRLDPPAPRATVGSSRRQPLGWLLIVVGALVVLCLGLAARGSLAKWTLAQAESRLQRQILAAREPAAAALVASLVDWDERAIVPATRALVDPRPHVAAAAAETLRELVARWQLLPASRSTSRIAALAAALAEIADRLPPRQRSLARDFAARMLVWPLDSEQADTAEVIACCERVLRLPMPLSEEPRWAVVSPEKSAASLAPPPATAPPLPVLPAPLPATMVPAAPTAEPAVLAPTRPDLLPDATREVPVEPRRFVAPRAVKIEG